MPETEGNAPAVRSAPWMPLVFMVFLLLIVGAVVALSFSPVAARLFPTSGQPDPSPAGSVDGVPAPDSSAYEPSVPSPNNDLTEPE